ncbi:hypothetical protein [Streptomyces sp. AcE210]|uniref:hypothetical protein n=1 Tax=Streptomyces sp. AcE210 TaxID=2292703 RepID=UPI001F0B79AC|nr:hypothetical protein [Streptomyces sp. AcE210]
MYDRCLDGEHEEPASERIEAYVSALLERWRDVTEDEEKTSPWPVGPLMDSASGPLISFEVSWNMAEEASTCAAALADTMGSRAADGPLTSRVAP